MISLVDEGLITLSQAAKLLPRRRLDKPVHTTSLWRWCRYGVKRGESTLHLEHIDSPSGIVTSKAAVARFLAALSTNNPAQNQTSAIQPNTRINRELDQLGL